MTNVAAISSQKRYTFDNIPHTSLCIPRTTSYTQMRGRACMTPRYFIQFLSTRPFPCDTQEEFNWLQAWRYWTQMSLASFCDTVMCWKWRRMRSRSWVSFEDARSDDIYGVYSVSPRVWFPLVVWSSPLYAGSLRKTPKKSFPAYSRRKNNKSDWFAWTPT